MVFLCPSFYPVYLEQKASSALEVTFRSCGMAPRLPPSKPGYDREPVSQVAAEAECSQAAIMDICKNLRQFGSVHPDCCEGTVSEIPPDPAWVVIFWVGFDPTKKIPKTKLNDMS